MSELLHIVDAAALVAIAAALWSGCLRGARGPQGRPGEAASTPEASDIPVMQEAAREIAGITPAVWSADRWEMLRDGEPTGHFVTQGTPDYREALGTPGLSLRHPDGRIENGVQ